MDVRVSLESDIASRTDCEGIWIKRGLPDASWRELAAGHLENCEWVIMTARDKSSRVFIVFGMLI